MTWWRMAPGYAQRLSNFDWSPVRYIYPRNSVASREMSVAILYKVFNQKKNIAVIISETIGKKEFCSLTLPANGVNQLGARTSEDTKFTWQVKWQVHRISPRSSHEVFVGNGASPSGPLYTAKYRITTKTCIHPSLCDVNSSDSVDQFYEGHMISWNALWKLSGIWYLIGSQPCASVLAKLFRVWYISTFDK